MPPARLLMTAVRDRLGEVALAVDAPPELISPTRPM